MQTDPLPHGLCSLLFVCRGSQEALPCSLHPWSSFQYSLSRMGTVPASMLLCLCKQPLGKKCRWYNQGKITLQQWGVGSVCIFHPPFQKAQTLCRYQRVANPDVQHLKYKGHGALLFLVVSVCLLACLLAFYFSLIRCALSLTKISLLLLEFFLLPDTAHQPHAPKPLFCL